jgi:hypothetical protein
VLTDVANELRDRGALDEEKSVSKMRRLRWRKGRGRDRTYETRKAKPENLIGDRAYDGDALDRDLRRDGTEMIAPHRANRSLWPALLSYSGNFEVGSSSLTLIDHTTISCLVSLFSN